MNRTIESQTPTCDIAGAYASGDLIGGKLEYTAACRRSGQLQTVTVSDLAKQKSSIDVVIFSADPTNTTFTDQAALDIDDADLPTIQAIISVASSDYVDFSDNAAATVAVSMPLISNDGSIYAAIVSRGTPTYVSASDLTIRLGVADKEE